MTSVTHERRSFKILVTPRLEGVRRNRATRGTLLELHFDDARFDVGAK